MQAYPHVRVICSEIYCTLAQIYSPLTVIAVEASGDGYIFGGVPHFYAEGVYHAAENRKVRIGLSFAFHGHGGREPRIPLGD